MVNVTTAMLIPFAQANQHVQTVVRELERILGVNIEFSDRLEIAKAYELIKKSIRKREREGRNNDV